MTVFELISRLGAAGIKLWVEDGQLKFKAPKGALTPELKDALVARKQDVIDFISGTRISSGDADRIPVVDRSKPLPLSHAQNRLWFIEQLTPGNSTFHIPAPLFLTGILDLPALEKAFLKLLQRHEALRTVFRVVNDEPMQIVQAVERFIVPVDDLTTLGVGERDAEARRRIEREIRAPFKLDQGPLLRAHLYKLDDNRYGLLVVMHHIVTDGWSMVIFVREIAALYAAERMGMNSPLPPIEIQYGDFAQWQRHWLQGEVLERQLGYWRTQLAGAPEQLMLPFDRSRPPMQTSNGAVLDVRLDEALTLQIKAVARQFDTTPYVILLAVYKIVLARWARQKDLCVGMPVAGRTRPEGKPSFGQFVAQVKEQVLGAQSHQDVPFEAIVDDLNIPRNLSFAPVYQVALSFTSAEGSSQKSVLGGLEIEPMPVELVAARLDLTLMLADYGDHIGGMLEFNTDLFNHDTVGIFIEHFRRVLDGATRDVDQCVDSLQLVNDAELRRLLALDESAEAVLPLVPMQRDFCLDSVREPDTLRNSIGDWLMLPFAVDEDKWRHALQAVITANPFQRVKIVESNRTWMEPFYQVIQRDAVVSLEVLDWRDRALTDEALQEALEIVVLPAWTVLGGPLTRHFLVRLTGQLNVAVVAAHHSMFDGVSKRQFFQQLLDSYAGKPITD